MPVSLKAEDLASSRRSGIGPDGFLTVIISAIPDSRDVGCQRFYPVIPETRDSPFTKFAFFVFFHFLLNQAKNDSNSADRPERNTVKDF